MTGERKILSWLISAIIMTMSFQLSAQQGYLHTEGKKIADGSGNNFIIRGIGTGNWMIQEGYMMQTSGVAGTQHAFRKKLKETIGVARTDSFYNVWLGDHFRKIDADSLASWGYNTIRVALHYKWFTPPIEEEPVAGEITWLNTGFELLDSLLSWCEANHLYLILDMHGAPGGQGKDANISDYDSSKPSLWESELNKTKLVALWYKLAQRYSEKKWIGGYDLINETNWTFPEGNNSPLLKLYKRITDTIRLVDNNHILFIEGNWWANDFSGLTPPWDDNMVYSFHKYWSYNRENSLDWIISLRDRYNIPVWLGETGENSNTWFTNLVRLAEEKNIGWSFWPVKKAGVNNPLRVKVNSDYRQLIDYWKGERSSPGADAAFQAVLGFANNHRLENCIIQRDVIDAIFRQPYTTALKPYKMHQPEDYIYATDYALGRNGYAYFDRDTGDYHVDTDNYTSWNQGGQLRNDGVDIQTCNDQGNSNGYNVGWTEDGEWMVYTLQNEAATLYDCEVRSTSENGKAYVQFSANGRIISDAIYLPATGSWTAWRTTTANDILLPAGDIELKLKFIKGGANLNYIRFVNPRTANETGFEALYCETSMLENEVLVHLNKPVTSGVSAGDFELRADNQVVPLESASISPDGYTIILSTGNMLTTGSQLTLTYQGNSVKSDGAGLETFSNKVVTNELVSYYEVPAKVEAEDFYANSGFELETSLDDGGGLNTAYANPGDYLDYLLYVPVRGDYQADFRIATGNGSAKIELLYEDNGKFVSIKELNLPVTGDWQNWQTQPTAVKLPAGKYRFRVQASQGEFNLNWINFSLLTGVQEDASKNLLRVFPNPANDFLVIECPGYNKGMKKLEFFDLKGSMVYAFQLTDNRTILNTTGIKSGVYLLRLQQNAQIFTQRLTIN